MQVLNYSIHPKNYNERRPERLKNIADIGLLVAGILELAPAFPGKEWVVFIGIAFKLITKFISEHP
jgi:hypothetical protein